MTSPKRFPLQPLIDHTRPDSLTALAAQVGVAPRTIYHWRRTGLALDQADVAAIAVASHPALIWPDLWQTLDQTGAHQ